MPKPELKTRVIAHNLPEKTYSETSFDYPKRKDVLQTDIPVMTTRTVEELHDPRHPPKRAVKSMKGTVYHNTGSTDSNVLYGSHHSFIEKSGHKSRKSRKNRRGIVQEVRKLRTEALNNAKKSYEVSGNMLDSINAGPRMILNAKTINKSEHPQLRLYENNKALHQRIESLRKTPFGVKAAHTLRRMG